jgi:hypothetical protein
LAVSKRKYRPQEANRPAVDFSHPWFWKTGLALIVAVLLVYGSTAGHDFVAYDDDRYVYMNPVVTDGLSLGGIGRAFTEQKFSASYPATSISHMISWEIFGDNPAGHHLLNVALHCANAVLLFALFYALTRQLWLGATIAFCFALHPLHVESVAWVTERKDVLSGFFGLLALLAYWRYTARPTFLRYAGVFTLFGLALLSKSMLVTLPCVFLLLDFWPLERLQAKQSQAASKRAKQNRRGRSVQQLLIEKIPLFGLSLFFCVSTYNAHLQTTLTTNPTKIPLVWRIVSAPIGYLSYLVKGIWPTDLACFYPHPALVSPERLGEFAFGAVVASTVLLLFTAFAIFQRAKRPWLLVGWFWYLGMLVPVIGLIQVGQAEFADRFIYLPLIGIYLILASAGFELARRFPARRNMLIVAAGIILTTWALLAGKQVGVWKNSDRLFTHTLEVTENNALIHNNFGVVLFEAGDIDRAVAQFHAAISIDQRLPDYHDNLGVLWATQGDLRKGISEFRLALAISPNYFNANYHMGEALFHLRDFAGAITHLQRADAANPGHPEVRRFLKQALATQSSGR